MRIIAGKWKGRTLVGPTSRLVRPMNDKVRGALFNVLGDISGKAFLDVYAGTGAVSLEALSRGAVLVEAIEFNRSAAKVIQQNAKTVGAGEDLDLILSPVEKWLDWPGNLPEPRYDVVVADPPYSRVENLVIERLGRYVKPGGLLVLSHSSKVEPPTLRAMEKLETKTYGDSALTFYKKL